MMMKFCFVAAGTLLVFSACNQGNKATTSGDSTVVADTVHGTITENAYYEASLPAASSPGRIIGLDLKSSGEAVMTTDFENQTPEIVEIGPWEKQGSDKISMSLVTVGSGSDKKNHLVFRQSGDTLVYEGTEYGSDGLKLVKKNKPAPKEKELVLWVSKKRVPCTIPPGGPRDCYQISYGKAVPVNDKEWEIFSEEIKGFDYKPGKDYQLKVKRKPVQNPPADASVYSYELIEVLSPKK